MGIHGSATCLINLGDQGECYAELLGEEREGMKVMFQMMNEARLRRRAAGPLQRLDRLSPRAQVCQAGLQGSSLLEMKNPEAPRVPIIQHPDVRRMLLWMKSHVDGLRAITLLYAICLTCI